MKPCFVLFTIFVVTGQMTHCYRESVDQELVLEQEQLTKYSEIHKADDKILAKLNESVDPCEDFYAYACGGPAGEPKLRQEMLNLGTMRRGTFEYVEESINKVLLDIFSKGEDEDNNFVSVKAFYSSCMELLHEDSNVTTAMNAVQRWLDKKIRWDIENPKNWTPHDSIQFSRSMARLLLSGIEFFVSAASLPDMVNPSINVGVVSDFGAAKFVGLDVPPHLWQSRLQTNDFAKMYEELLLQFSTLGYPVEQRGLNAKEAIDALATIGSKRPGPEFMATVNWTAIPRVTRCADLDGILNTGPLDWTSYCNELGLDEGATGAIYTPIIALNIANGTTAKVLSDLGPAGAMRVMETVALMGAAEFVGGAISKSFADMRARVGGGIRQWSDFCLQTTSESFPWIVSKHFIKSNFPPEAKDTATSLMQMIRSAFFETLKELDWMDSTTKAAAARKADVMGLEVGYPSWILDDKLMDRRFGDLHIQHDEAFAVNILEVTRWKSLEKFGTWGKQIDVGKWVQSPVQVSQYYNPLLNRVVFSAGSMQSPVIQSDSIIPTLYGGLGMVMGHEFTHAFDSNGAKRDEKGNLKNWWHEETRQKFEERVGCFKEQYDNMSIPSVGSHVDGYLTLGENIADNGGLALSWRAFQHAKSMGLRGSDATVPLRSGGELTADKLFFIGFGQFWCTAVDSRFLAAQLKNDVHSPASARVRGVMQNSPAFARTFNCKKGSAMNPGDENRCSIWGGPAWKVSKRMPSPEGPTASEEVMQQVERANKMVNLPSI